MAALAAATYILFAAAGTAGVDQVDAQYLGALERASRARGLAAARDWQVLLHYRITAFGGWKSEADGLGFFLAGAAGRRDPQAELDASLAAFLAPTPVGDEHAQCRFPARWQWLKQALAIDTQKVPDRACPIFDAWRTGISAEAVTLVYATAYINSPASMYGHTFLRLSRSTGEGNALLDYAVNFAADVDTDNGILYALKGVTGGFAGRFYVVPYYVKVQEYSNMESRDLWEYELSLTPAQVHRLVLHAWETRTTHFDYYFFTRNCSYRLLELLDVADPNLHLVDHFTGAVIPSDTVREILRRPGLVRSSSVRPSLLSMMRQRRDALTGGEVRAAEAWATAPPEVPPSPLHPADRAADQTADHAAGWLPERPADLAKERQAFVIDAAYDYLRFREGLHADPSARFKQRERHLLLARGRLGVPPQEVVTRAEIDAPERGHASFRMGGGGGFSDQAGPFQTLSLRGAIHDYLDPSTGYPADARLEMGDLHLRFEDQARAVRLDRLDLIDIVSAAPWDRWVQGTSWKVWIGADNARELGCARRTSPQFGWRCLYAGVTTGGGISARFGPRRSLLVVLLTEADVGGGPAFSPAGGYRLGAGGEMMVVGAASDWWHFELGGRYIAYLLGSREPNFRTRATEAFMINRRYAVRVAFETAGTYAQVAGELLGYF